MTKIVLFLTAILFSTGALAGSKATNPFKIDRMSLSTTHDRVYVYPIDSSSVINPARCSKSDRFVFELVNNYRSNRILASLTTLASTKVDTLFYVYDDRCIKIGSYTYPLAVSLQIR